MSEEYASVYLLYLNNTGHSKLELTWDPNNEDEVKAVEQKFIELSEKGCIISVVSTFLGIFKRKKEIKIFDEKYRHIIAEGEVLSFTIHEGDIIDDKRNKKEEYKLFVPHEDKVKPNTKYMVHAPISGG
jgi:hypothetical protein